MSSVITLEKQELRNLADVVGSGEVLATEILDRRLPRWFLRLLLGENVLYHIYLIGKIVRTRDYTAALIKLLYDYDPGGSSDD
jgi:hypothetical protein